MSDRAVQNLAYLSPSPFVIDMDQKIFTVPVTTDVSFVGKYVIIYEVCLESYPDSCLTSTEPFTITIIDPCDSAVLSEPLIETQVYTISQPEV